MKTTVELITLKDEIIVSGLGYKKCRETNSVKLNSEWDFYGKWNLLDGVKNVKFPETDYAVRINSDFYIGKSVKSSQNQDEIYDSCVIPTGEYLKITWNSESFDKLVMEDMGGDKAVVNAFFEENKLEKLLGSDGIYIEVYPKNTIGKEEPPITEFPEMYTLVTINSK